MAERESSRQKNSDVSVWDVASDAVTRCEGLKNLAYCVGIGKDGKRIAAGEYDGRLHLWDAGQAKARTVLPAHAGPIYSVAVSPDGDSIVTGGADKIVRVWNAQTGLLRKELDGHPGLVFSVSYDAGRDRVLAAGKDLALSRWNVRNEEISAEEKAVIMAVPQAREKGKTVAEVDTDPWSSTSSASKADGPIRR